ncbi:MAG: phosphatidylserine decarboxylase [Endomicrobium sp.]|jgi:phosphatidylserine decarboxylase|nr:phosphatidylserine decarboxylase [Endomicrobium sp.]
MKLLKEGYLFVFVPIASGLLASLIITNGIILIIIEVICVFISLFCMYFFRDPDVQITNGDNLIISPCSGTVLEICELEKNKIVRVFLSVFDVHLQRSPVSGEVISIRHKNGKFLNAMSPYAHIVNEQNTIIIKNKSGEYFVKQVAGIIARRCVSWVKPGDILKCGDKIGMIKFGSQVDLYMPKSVVINVKTGDKVIAGVTIFAFLN